MRGTRGVARVLGACAAALTLTLASPGTAQAASGVLVIDGALHSNPSGCYPLGDFVPSEVANFTDGTASVWSGPFCDGRVTGAVLPGQVVRPAPGLSLFIP
ncbi:MULTISPECIES: hypothetical protein [unclassified Streptomyces]|uniref:hypothetical protein n=1 Tax=unclassified Streptomyces TaxID=2593676 RepID=UPI002E15BD70|nr:MULTISPECIES: hypothetical protein [unclassified Streptomyces]WSR23210.1 hypothetical protein OG573_31480 [Streptomyces sp. NBC_01205]